MAETNQSSTYQLEDLLAVMAQLRDPDSGCPWDIQQTFQSIVPSTLEECYELAAAIEQEDYLHVREELGDVLFQVVFYAQLGKEASYFDFADVVNGLTEKLIRRHPHVFPVEGEEDVKAFTEEEVKANWEAIKQRERTDKQQHRLLDDIPVHLPALTRAQKLQKRASSVGFDWPELSGALAKIQEELGEFEEAVEQGSAEDMSEELGDLLFSCVNAARHLGLDAETVLRTANRKFEKRFDQVESSLQSQGVPLSEASQTQMEAAWEQAKEGA